MKNRKSLLIVLALFAFVFASCNQNADQKPVLGKYTIASTETTEAGIVKSVINYESIDTAGKPITLSGYFEYPENTAIKQLILSVHGTIQFNSQAPSATKSAGSLAATKENARVYIAPDYLGYGLTGDKVHPYMNQELTAINSLDCEFAVLQYFIDKNIALTEDHYTIVIGYSQGGSSALATHKYIENNISEEKQTLINLKKSYCGGTPADLVKTMDVYFAAEKTNTILVFLVIQGMLESYPDVLGNYTLQDFYTDKVDANKVAAGINAKTQVGLYSAMAVFPSDTSANNIHSEPMHNKDSEFYKAFISCLQKNDLTDWEPKHPINFYHSTTDDTVPFENYEVLMSAEKMGRYPELVKGQTGTGNHGTYGGTFSVLAAAEINAME